MDGSWRSFISFMVVLSILEKVPSASSSTTTVPTTVTPYTLSYNMTTTVFPPTTTTSYPSTTSYTTTTVPPTSPTTSYPSTTSYTTTTVPPTSPTTSYPTTTSYTTTTVPSTSSIPPPYTTTTHVPPGEGKIWAFLVASSTGYFNYRHQADVCHAYQILHSNGIPDEQIIVMMADDIAYNRENPTPGVIINTPGGRNVYEGVLKDYTGNTVTAENFLNILSGNKAAMRGIGSGRVIESGPNDYIFVNFVDHGGPGILCFGESDILTAGDLINTFNAMAQQSKFSKMFLYIEACHSGSMFDDILPDDLNVIVMTAADPHENSYACYYDEKRETYLADVFSTTWMHDTEHERLSFGTLHHQFERVRTWTNTSHVEEYGDLSIGSTRLSQFLGFRMNSGLNSVIRHSRPHLTDLVSNIDVPIQIIDNKIHNTKDETERRLYKLKKHHLLKMRRSVDDIMVKIVSYLTGYNQERQSQLNNRNYRLGSANLPCYNLVLRRFSNKCFNVAKHPYTRVHLSKLVNMCDASWVTTNNILDAISAVCDIKINYSTSIL